MSDLGERIKELRKKNKLNQNEFCKKINLAQSRLSEIESNKTKPSYETLVSIKDNFNISLDWLVTGEIYDNGYSDKTSQPELESDLLKEFRELSDRDKREVIAYIKMKRDLYQGNPTARSLTSMSGNQNGEEVATIETA